MTKAAIIGKGNVGTHLAKAFDGDIVSIDMFSSREVDRLTDEYTFIILAVRDTDIVKIGETVSEILPDFNGIVAHCAGSVDMEVLKSFFKNYGVFYPMQSFSKNIPILNYREIPLFIEGNNTDTEKRLMELAAVLSDNVRALNSEQRLKLHTASVMSCNFVNALYIMSEEILDKTGLPFDVLRPLIRKTTEKIMTHSPAECQTGPAIRGDKIIMEKHLDGLKDFPSIYNIYEEASSYIFNKFHNQLDNK